MRLTDFIPRLSEDRKYLVIPIVTFVLIWTVEIIIWMINGLRTMWTMISMFEPDMTMKAIALAIVAIIAGCYWGLSRWSKYNTQKEQAERLKLRKANNEKLTEDEEIEILKVEKFFPAYRYGCIIGFILSAVFGGLGVWYAVPEAVDTPAWMYIYSLIGIVCISVVIDKVAIESICNGKFEKYKTSLFQQLKTATSDSDANTEKINAVETALISMQNGISELGKIVSSLKKN